MEWKLLFKAIDIPLKDWIRQNSFNGRRTNQYLSPLYEGGLPGW